MTIGITGPSGAGKSLICGIFRDRGFLVLDCDQIYHGLTCSPSDCTRELCAEYGTEVLNADGSLDRRALAAVVFAPGAGDRLEKLNEITHKYVLDEVRRIISGTAPGSVRGFVIDAPLLFQANFDRECDMTAAVLAPYELRLERLKKRDGLDEDSLRSRLDAAPENGWYMERCDRMIWNEGSTSAAERAVDGLIEDSPRYTNRK